MIHKTVTDYCRTIIDQVTDTITENSETHWEKIIRFEFDNIWFGILDYEIRTASSPAHQYHILAEAYQRMTTEGVFPAETEFIALPDALYCEMPHLNDKPVATKPEMDGMIALFKSLFGLSNVFIDLYAYRNYARESDGSAKLIDLMVFPRTCDCPMHQRKSAIAVHRLEQLIKRNL